MQSLKIAVLIAGTLLVSAIFLSCNNGTNPEKNTTGSLTSVSPESFAPQPSQDSIILAKSTDTLIPRNPASTGKRVTHDTTMKKKTPIVVPQPKVKKAPKVAGNTLRQPPLPKDTTPYVIDPETKQKRYYTIDPETGDTGWYVGSAAPPTEQPTRPKGKRN